MQKLDTVLRICGHDIRIEEKEFNYSNNDIGVACFADCQIFIKPDSAYDVKRITLLHKLFHIINRAKKLGLNDERAISNLATSFFAMLRDNSEYFKKIFIDEENQNV